MSAVTLCVNFPHDLLCPLNRRRNQRFCPRTRLGIKQVFSGFQVTCDQDASDNPDDSFAAFVERDHVRFLFAIKNHVITTRGGGSQLLGQMERPASTLSPNSSDECGATPPCVISIPAIGKGPTLAKGWQIWATGCVGHQPQ